MINCFDFPAAEKVQPKALLAADAILSLKPSVFPRLDAPATPEAIMRAVRATGGAPDS